MRRFLNPLLARCLAIFTALLLLGGQQAALAHMVGHAAVQAGLDGSAAAHSDDEGHGAALALSHVCTTCLAFAGADGAPPSQAPVLALAEGETTTAVLAAPPAPTLAFLAAFLSRAPPRL